MKFSVVALLGLATLVVAGPQVIHEAAEVSAGLAAKGVEPPTDFGPDDVDFSPAINATDLDPVAIAGLGYGQPCVKAKECNSRRCGWCSNASGWYKCNLLDSRDLTTFLSTPRS
ncbi:uncharacterized protein EI97DRAFT_432996 [Westerdykella ornata]|uniref:Uncharacterized protein n=1 Tax=Westerdykella ornata TaxID=318751 RepID=A0A6A6JJT6_WESOR|nr:uncharacterized protein EI97DRAFT_432996 [Westerdykella ornata]KAF2276757.1 hypothetical protein EI97DRAFT_432996 [Westerdykella ornata]